MRESALAHPDYDPNSKALVDCRGAEFLAPEKTLPAAGKTKAKSPVISREAIPDNREDYGLWKMDQGWAGGDEQVLITTDINEARERVELPKDSE